MRRASRLGRLTSTTRSPAAVSARVSVAPNEPVLSTPIARDVAVAAHPGQQRLVAAVGGRELPVAEQPAVVVDRGGVVGVLVGVDAADHGDSRGSWLSCWDSLLR